jgi:hypothetical protein
LEGGQLGLGETEATGGGGVVLDDVALLATGTGEEGAEILGWTRLERTALEVTGGTLREEDR